VFTNAHAVASRPVSRPDRLLMLVARVPAWGVLALLVLVSAILRFWAGKAIPVPWIAPDELVYGLLGQGLYRDGELTVLGGPTAFYSLVYPALVGLPLSLGDLERGYTLLKGIQALVMSLTAVPVYFWARRLSSNGWAFVAAALTLALPGLAYSGLIMTEVAFYPVMTLAAWALATALARPTRRNQVVLVAAIATATATRLQAVVLVPVLLTALAVKCGFDRSWRTARRFGAVLAGLALLAAAWSAWQLRGGGSWSKLFGGYQTAGETSYELGEAAKYIAYHAGSALLLTGIVPLCALALLVLDAATGREEREEVRAYLAVAASLVVWLVVEVGVFASRHVLGLAERDLLSLAPITFVGFALWLARGGPRRRLSTSIVALLAALPVLALPVKDFIAESTLHNAFTLIPLYRLQVREPGVNLELVVFGGATAIIAAFALLPRRSLILLPLALLLAGGAASLAAGRYVREAAELQQRKIVGPDRRWVDRVVDEPVAYLYNGDFYWNAVWEIGFWNRSIERVYDLPRTTVPGPMPQTRVHVRPDGRVVLPDGSAPAERYVVASTVFNLFGSPVHRIYQEDIEQAGLILWRLEPPFRLSTVMSGVRPNSEIRGSARLIVYACGRGSFSITLVGIEPLRAELKQNGKLVRIGPRGATTVRLEPGEEWSGTVPAKPAGVPGRSTCTFEVFASSLLFTTRFQFDRA